MLTGPMLGQAMREAMTLKKVRQRHVAEEFGVTQSSVSEWLKFGRIDKKHIPHLVDYFADVVSFEHWGLPASWDGRPAGYSQEAMDIAEIYEHLPLDMQEVLFATATAMDRRGQKRPDPVTPEPDASTPAESPKQDRQAAT